MLTFLTHKILRSKSQNLLNQNARLVFQNAAPSEAFGPPRATKADMVKNDLDIAVDKIEKNIAGGEDGLTFDVESAINEGRKSVVNVVDKAKSVLPKDESILDEATKNSNKEYLESLNKLQQNALDQIEKNHERYMQIAQFIDAKTQTEIQLANNQVALTKLSGGVLDAKTIDGVAATVKGLRGTIDEIGKMKVPKEYAQMQTDLQAKINTQTGDIENLLSKQIERADEPLFRIKMALDNVAKPYDRNEKAPDDKAFRSDLTTIGQVLLFMPALIAALEQSGNAALAEKAKVKETELRDVAALINENLKNSDPQISASFTKLQESRKTYEDAETRLVQARRVVNEELNNPKTQGELDQARWGVEKARAEYIEGLRTFFTSSQSALLQKELGRIPSPDGTSIDTDKPNRPAA